MSTPALPSPRRNVRRAPVPRRAAAPNALFAVLPAALLVYAAMLPPEVRFSIADQTFYAPRIVGFALLQWIFKRIASAPLKLRVCDYVFFGGTFWMTFAFMVYYGPGEGFPRGVALTFDAAIPYLVGRLSISNANDFRRFLVLVAPGLLFVGLTMLAEVIAGRPLLRPAFASVFGSLSAYQNGVEVGKLAAFIDYRMGILRTGGPFSHPIHAGLFLASFFSLYAFSGLRGWPSIAGKVAPFFALLSVSSAAYLGLLMAIGLLIVDVVQRMVNFISWRLIIPVMAALLTLANFATERGIINYLLQFSLNTTTARYRRIIWDYGVQSVEKHPWFGIGFTSFERLSWMVSSVDNHWLMLAIRFGVIPAFTLLGVAIAILVILGRSTARDSAVDRNLKIGMAISLFMMALLGFSVAFFGGMQTWFYLFMGMCMAVGTSTTVSRVPVRRPVRPVGRAPALKRAPLRRGVR